MHPTSSTGHSPRRSPKAPDYKSRTFGTTCRRSMNCEVRTTPPMSCRPGQSFSRFAVCRNSNVAISTMCLAERSTSPKIKAEICHGPSRDKNRNAPFRSDGSFPHHVCGCVEVRARSRCKPCCPSGIGPADIHLRSDSGHRRHRWDTASVFRQRVRNSHSSGLANFVSRASSGAIAKAQG
jgi:hypothetical protein